MAINWFNGGPPAEPGLRGAAGGARDCRDHGGGVRGLLAVALDRRAAACPEALAQAKQFEALLSAHVVEPEDALDHKHNSLVAGVAQSVLVNALKVDETAFRRSESERNRHLEEIRAAIEKYRAERASESSRMRN